MKRATMGSASSCPPGRKRSALSFSGIGDLLDRVLDEVLAPLPARRNERSRARSSSATTKAAAGSPRDRPRAPERVACARRRAPVVVAIDDVQWLDPASAGGLAFAGRRLRPERVGLLLSRRAGLDSILVEELRRSLPSDRVGDPRGRPTRRGALHHVVQSHLGLVLPRPVLDEVRDVSGGNPFYALEIVRTLQRSSVSVDGGQPLPIPESLHDLVHGRLAALPPQSRDFLLAAAAHAHPTIAVTEAASGIDREIGLRPALEARVVELEKSRIRFTHPLLAAGAYETADRVGGPEIHARLAELLDDPEARAWQLAASIGSPDEAVADALEEAADHARGRGALRPAALDARPGERVDPA